MPEPFKNLLNAEAVARTARAFAATWAPFRADEFRNEATAPLHALELKARIHHVADTLRRHLPDDFGQAARRLPQAAAWTGEDEAGLHGFPVWPLCSVVERHGLDHPTPSLDALEQLTERMSAEFAVRPFLLQHRELTLKRVHGWAQSHDEHLRRLASEGTRPRLPWGQHLRPYIDDPSPTLALLERLKDDPSEYVRRSVANHLNDISKDHPDRAIDVLGRWVREGGAYRERIARHGLRTLIKKGHPGALAVLGYGPPSVRLTTLTAQPGVVLFGDAVQIHMEVRSTGTAPQPLIIDYLVHHKKAHGGHTPKVFKWTRRTLAPGEHLVLSRRHALRPISTRRYYPGAHWISLRINGQDLGRADFELSMS